MPAAYRDRVLIEVGPVTIRRVGRPACTDPALFDPALFDVALEGIDDEFVLVDESPVAADDLWRKILGDMGSGDLCVIHPSWWPRRRLDRLRSAAPVLVRCMTRSEFIGERVGGACAIVEVDQELVTVRRGATTVAFDRDDIDTIAEAAGCDGEVLFDAPAGVAGTDLRIELVRRGIAVRDVDIDLLCAMPSTGSPSRRRPARRAVIAAVGVGALGAIAAGAVWRHPDQGPPRHPRESETPESGTVALVEGRIAVSVPSQWTVRRVTGGPGSRRVEVSAPGDTGAVLHITGSYVPDSTLAAAAEVLGRAAATQPAGVFVGFRTGAVAGRDAVTYTENRPGRVIRWSVVLDGATRISIGCQSPPTAEETIREACDQAIRSARESVGTAAGR